jgi:hypothetical protein
MTQMLRCAKEFPVAGRSWLSRGANNEALVIFGVSPPIFQAQTALR